MARRRRQNRTGSWSSRRYRRFLSRHLSLRGEHAGQADRVGGQRGCLTAPFLPPPSEPDRRLSYSSGSPVPGGREGFRPRACRPPHPPRLRSTCPPSPCGRLSRPRTTTGTLSPWGRPRRGLQPFRRSRFSHHVTYVDWFRSPTHPLNRVHLPDRCIGRSCRPSDGCDRHPIHAAS